MVNKKAEPEPNYCKGDSDNNKEKLYKMSILVVFSLYNCQFSFYLIKFSIALILSFFFFLKI